VKSSGDENLHPILDGGRFMSIYEGMQGFVANVSNLCITTTVSDDDAHDKFEVKWKYKLWQIFQNHAMPSPKIWAHFRRVGGRNLKKLFESGGCQLLSSDLWALAISPYPQSLGISLLWVGE
jgi:hypothetical protein